MSTKKTHRALYVPPALRANNNSINSHLTSPKEIDQQSSSESPGAYASTNKQVTDLEQGFKSLLLSDSCASTDDSSFKKHFSRHKSSSNDGQSSDQTGEPTLKLKDFQHILELYNFPKDFKDFHLEAELTGFEDSGFYLKWVDDAHCLAVFSSNNEANRALAQISGLLMKARRIEDASLASKWKIARSPGDWAMPYKKRPLTTSSTARRLISNHLGIACVKTKSVEEATREDQDKALLREARARAEAIRQAQKAIWEGD
ncbi:unnamed protein product [Heterobilharzia americana]|nr:unnamed protein product [Heterobilharzia americana]